MKFLVKITYFKCFFYWNHRQIETQGGAQIEDKTKGKLQASLPGQQPISQLHSTKAFGAYLSQKKNYKKPKFIKYIMNSSEI